MTKTLTLKKFLIFGILYLITGGLILSLFEWVPNQQNTFPLFRDFIILFASILLTKYFIYMAASPWYDFVTRRQELKRAAKNEKALTKTEPYKPFVSVIVPAWNEEVGLVRTAKTILKSTYRDLEIIVVNDGSTDESDRLMQEFIMAYESSTLEVPHIPIRYYYKENGGKGKALNYGIRQSSGDLIISIDADCALQPDTVENFVKHFQDTTVMAAVGNVKIGNTSHILGTLQYLEFLFSFYFKKADSLFNTIYIIGGAAGAFRREVFEKIGFYSSHNITEDIDLSVRIQKAGMRIVYAADAVVYTEGATTLKGLMAQRLRWKHGRFQTFAEHKNLFFSNKPEHSKLLTWFVLPLAVFGDVQLFFEVIFLSFLYVYSMLTHDFSSFVSGLVVVSSMFLVQIVDDKSVKKLPLYLLAPIGWLLFYITTAVEYRALIKGMWGVLSKQKLRWQRWDRAGVFEKNQYGT